MKAFLYQARRNWEREFITRHADDLGWNVSRLALRLGMERSALHRKMKDLGITDARIVPVPETPVRPPKNPGELSEAINQLIKLNEVELFFNEQGETCIRLVKAKE